MPQIKLKHIVSFSSEDPAYPADNLLKSETYRKWQCADPAEKQVSVVIELEKASKIHSIDIGNNGSAFVEVLAGRSSSEASQDFQLYVHRCCAYGCTDDVTTWKNFGALGLGWRAEVLLVASSFMSPSESKSGTNSNRVRMFGPDKLSRAVADQKWDRVKFICTQPYNKTSCYGLSFVNLHSPPEVVDDVKPQEKVQSRLGAFILKDETVDSITTGSLFKKRKENIGTSSVKSTAAELREASKNPETVSVHATLTSDVKLSKVRKQESTEEKREAGTLLGSKRKVQDSTSGSAEQQTGSSKEKKILSEEKVVNPPTKKVKVLEENETEISLHEILKDVIFVLSGFKNPERSQLRDKALSMGARYRGDWDNTCTHLICAFMNTPKFNQVKATRKGKIVSKHWITDCLKRRKRMSERRYKLKGDDSDGSDGGSTTEDEEYDNRLKQTSGQQSSSLTKCTVSTVSEPTKDEPVAEASTSRNTEVNPQKPAGTHNTETISETLKLSEDEVSSGHDTEDEIRRAMEDEDDPYGGSTECESDDEEGKADNAKGESSPTKLSSTNLLELPDFFSKMVFLLYGEFEHHERRTLTRYITAYNGELEEYMSDNVKYVITNETWDDNFNEALVDNSCLTFVRPKWIYACHDKRSFVPYQPFIVVPR